MNFHIAMFRFFFLVILVAKRMAPIPGRSHDQSLFEMDKKDSGANKKEYQSSKIRSLF